MFNQFNDLTDQANNSNPDNIVNCKNYDIEDIQKLQVIPNSLSLFHLNTCSLNKNFNDFEYLLKTTNQTFDIIAISESRISKTIGLTNNIELPNYSIEYTPTESHAGGTLLYINNNLAYKPRNDLNIYKSCELESTFIEIINPKRTNIIVGCIYRHPSMDLNEFNSNYLNELLNTVSKENKSIFLLGDFNVDLLKYEIHSSTNEFLDSLASNMFLPYILLPTRVTSHSKTLIDNIFSNHITKEADCGNITLTISDHLPQFLIVPSMFSDSPTPKSNIYERDWSSFNKEQFVLDYFEKDWNFLLKIECNDVDKSLDNFLKNINELLDKHAPYKKLTKYKLKLKTKPWISLGLQKSISIKNSMFRKYIRLKEPYQKEQVHEKYKHYRNLLSTLMKKSKQMYFEEFFSNNLTNLKNTWKGIRNIISLKQPNNCKINLLSHNNENITDPKKMADIFNDYFSTIAQKTKSNIKNSYKSFKDFLINPTGNTFFLEPCSPDEIKNLITSMNHNKSTGPNSIPVRILKLLNNDISNQLADIFNLSFSTGIFPSQLKLAKIIPIHKKESKLLCSNYRPISLLSNIDKILEKTYA